ncbi:MAG TPA: S-layer homology domain-containing protein [Allocoleopsis sp.]
MRKARCTGCFYQFSKNFRCWKYILVGSILSSTMLSAAVGVANTGGTQPANAPAHGNHSSSLGASLLNNLLGADALRPQTQTGRSPGRPQPAMRSRTQLAQSRTFPDIQGNWARTFIEALAERGIIKGFPDGTFRPDEPVTRAQFAAMIRQAFPGQPKRQGTNFVDVSVNYWGYDAIQAAYRLGFLEGYPNNVFIPEQNIPRVQVLVSLATGLELSPPAQVATILNQSFQDAAQIPDYARNQIASATLNQLVVNYPDVALLNPNQNATRADVAAFIYQALVKEGSLPSVNATDVASQYIVGYKPPIAKPPTPSPDQVAALRQQLLLPNPPVVERLRRIIGGGSSISTPTAFGAQSGDFFLGGTYQNRARFTDLDDGAVVLGFGLGDAQKLVALETAVTSYSTIRQDFFTNGGVSFKLHHLFPGSLGVAFGVENAINWGDIDAGRSFYGVVSKVIQLKPRVSDPLSQLTVSAGVGSGRFRSEDDVRNDTGSANVFGSVGLRVAEPISLIGEWTGQDLNIGASIAPIPGVPLVITPAAADITGNAGDGARFILGVGYGITF